MEDITGILYDLEDKRRIIVKKDMLLNQLRRTSPIISKHFDNICNDELVSLSELLSEVYFMISGGFIRSGHEQNVFFATCSSLLCNAGTTFAAALSLLRSGYRLQPGILVRNILENVSTVGHLFINEGDLAKYQAGKLKSTQTIQAMKRILPPFGYLYGFYSKHFAHIGKLYQNMQPLNKFKNRKDPALVVNIGFLKISLWALYVTTELVYLDFIGNRSPRFWIKLKEGQYLYKPTEETREWQKNFFTPEIEYFRDSA